MSPRPGDPIAMTPDTIHSLMLAMKTKLEQLDVSRPVVIAEQSEVVLPPTVQVAVREHLEREEERRIAQTQARIEELNRHAEREQYMHWQELERMARDERTRRQWAALVEAEEPPSRQETVTNYMTREQEQRLWERNKARRCPRIKAWWQLNECAVRALLIIEGDLKWPCPERAIPAITPWR